MLKMKLTFNCSFGSDSTPASLLALVSMVLYGASITSQTTVSSTPQPALTISQLLQFSSSACKKVKQSPDVPRHNAARETPLPIYLGIMLHSKTRKRELVDKLFELGLSVSYDRVLNISTELGNKVCHHYEAKGVVCPPELKCGLFTTAAIDNIDHDPSSTSSHDLFHGTGISLFQQPADTFAGLDQVLITNDADDIVKGKRKHLPESYTSVPPATLPRQDLQIPRQNGPNKADGNLIPQARTKECR